MGFEPMIQLFLYVDLANQCLKPLSHTSNFHPFTAKKERKLDLNQHFSGYEPDELPITQFRNIYN